VQSGSYVITHTFYSDRHADVTFADNTSCYLVAYLHAALNSSTFIMNETRPRAGRGKRGGSGVGGRRSRSVPVTLHVFFIPVIKINFSVIPSFLFYGTACPLSNQLAYLHGTQYTEVIKGHTRLCTFQFPIIGNPNMAATQTCEVGSTMALLTAHTMKCYVKIMFCHLCDFVTLVCLESFFFQWLDSPLGA
jgi:hypothetical protein